MYNYIINDWRMFVNRFSLSFDFSADFLYIPLYFCSH